MKQKVRHTIDTLSVYDFYGNINTVIDMLQNLRNALNVIVLDVRYDYRDNSYDILAITEREETDAEYKKRLEDEAKKANELALLMEKKRLSQEKKQADEYATYLKLKQKYE